MQPDIIFIVADDLGSADLGCYGGPTDISPNLDRLAREGLLFTRAYANSSVCSPTRFALITGRWQYRLRAAAEEPLGGKSTVLGLPPAHPTLPSLLRNNGYSTALIGKWHLGHAPRFGPLLSGYDEFFGPMGGGVDYFSHLNFSGVRDLWEGAQPSQAKGYLTDLISNRAADFVARERGEKPYFLSVHFTAPHWPWESREDAEESKRIGSQISHLDGGSVATYRKMIKQMDEGIGAIVNAIQPGRRDNTLIVFTSDNGGERYSNNWPFVGGKMDLLEGGLRVPQIAWWPSRIRANGRSAQPTISMDWMATMLEATDTPPHVDYPLDGMSLMSVLNEPSWRRIRQLHWRMKHRQQAATISDEWKYLRVDGHEYLFDLNADQRERANLAKRQPERLRNMRRCWEEWARSMPGIPEDAAVYLLWDDSDMPRSTH